MQSDSDIQPVLSNPCGSIGLDVARDHSESLASDLEQGRIWSTEAPEKPVSKETVPRERWAWEV